MYTVIRYRKTSGDGGVESNAQGGIATTHTDFKSGSVANRIAPPCSYTAYLCRAMSRQPLPTNGRRAIWRKTVALIHKRRSHSNSLAGNASPSWLVFHFSFCVRCCTRSGPVHRLSAGVPEGASRLRKTWSAIKDSNLAPEIRILWAYPIGSRILFWTPILDFNKATSLCRRVPSHSANRRLSSKRQPNVERDVPLPTELTGRLRSGSRREFRNLDILRVKQALCL